jgi:2,3-bisphosphoglycerate-independent phosphoglycerate mutase
MADFNLIRGLSSQADTKIVLLVMDGLGGVPREPGGPTELEFARTPNLDRLAAEGMVGLSIPIGNGISPGSGPGHLGLFGYDPVKYLIGRGVLESCGIGFPLTPEDVAARGNFCTVDENLLITDRRAGRIPTEKCAELVKKLRAIKLSGVEIFVEPVQDYRFALIFRGKGLSDKLNETDPQKEGRPPLAVKAQAEGAASTAELANRWIAAAREILKNEKPANMVTLRGWAKEPGLPGFKELYKLNALAVAVYPMYKGLASLVGMEVLPGLHSLDEQLAALKDNWGRSTSSVPGTPTAAARWQLRRQAAEMRRWTRSPLPRPNRTSSSSPATTARPRSGKPTPGTPCRPCSTPRAAPAATRSRASARPNA